MIFLLIFLFVLILVLIKLFLLFLKIKKEKISYDGFSAFGFTYDPIKDIFYSTKNAWQKNFGYTHDYDVLAPFFRMIMDTESIKFQYDNKNWLINFWKGQYGLVTGAEIGIYYTEDKRVNKKTMYFPVKDTEMLNMCFILYRKGKRIMSIRAKHWWLAAFKLGLFSKPKDLSMDLNITFLNKGMLDAFLKSFKKLGYKKGEYHVIDNTFCFKYIKPRTRKVWSRNFLIEAITQHFNRKNVRLYNKYLGNLIDENGIDDSFSGKENFIMVSDFIPDFLKNNSKDSSKNLKRIMSKSQDNVVFFSNEVTGKGIKRHEKVR